ncbi:MAG: ATPase inhibitor subunit zeta [Solirubrobacterales bacterium]
MQTFLQTMHSKGSTAQAAFVAEQEGAFWVRARRNRLLAEWACDLTDDDSQNYTRLLLDVDFAKAASPETTDFLLVKIRNDLMGYGIFLSMEQMRDEFDRVQRQAWLERNG